MKYICPICQLKPSSHSLINVLETTELIYYYTCPAQAKLYYDVPGIINHYDGVLSEMPENKEWIWIVDSLDFSFIHAIQISVAIALAKFCGAIPTKVNIIQYNPIDNGPYTQASQAAVDMYKRILEERRIIATVRHSRGQDIDAACGQLANKTEA